MRGLDHAAADAGEAARQAVDLEDQDRAHDGIGQRLAGSCGVAQHQAALQLGQLVVLDVGARQGAEAGIDAIGGLAPVDHSLDHRRRAVDGAVAGGIERDRARLVEQPAQVFQRQGSGGENECAGHAFLQRVSLVLTCIYKLMSRTATRGTVAGATRLGRGGCGKVMQNSRFIPLTRRRY
jgi:hypothetical protein